MLEVKTLQHWLKRVNVHYGSCTRGLSSVLHRADNVPPDVHSNTR